jgi:hypothetical protein
MDKINPKFIGFIVCFLISCISILLGVYVFYPLGTYPVTRILVAIAVISGFCSIFFCEPNYRS